MLIQDEWLSQYFESGAYQLKILDDSTQSKKIDQKGFIYTKIGTNQVNLVSELLKNGFYFIETSVLWKQHELYQPKKYNDSIEIRSANETDLLEVQNIAKDAFEHSRFYIDTNIKRNIAEKIKVDWVTNYFLGKRGDNMYVATLKGKVVGFLLIVQGTIIDLIAVSKQFYRQGIGSMMIFHANKSLGALQAGTQIRNKESINLYQKTGFSLQTSNYILHKH